MDTDADTKIQSLTDAKGQSFSALTGNATCDVESYPPGFNPSGGNCLDDLAQFARRGLGSHRPQIAVGIVDCAPQDVELIPQAVQLGSGDDELAVAEGQLARPLARHPIPLSARLGAELARSPPGQR